jgi:hypothetical protein
MERFPAPFAAQKRAVKIDLSSLSLSLFPRRRFAQKKTAYQMIAHFVRSPCFQWWAGMDSNHRNPKMTDLQSVPFNHSGTYPHHGDPGGTRTLDPLIRYGAEDETRTRDPHHGKVVLYQLSYFRKIGGDIQNRTEDRGFAVLGLTTWLCRHKYGAEDETRTRDPHHGKVVLYQLSYFRATPKEMSVVPMSRSACASR